MTEAQKKKLEEKEAEKERKKAQAKEKKDQEKEARKAYQEKVGESRKAGYSLLFTSQLAESILLNLCHPSLPHSRAKQLRIGDEPADWQNRRCPLEDAARKEAAPWQLTAKTWDTLGCNKEGSLMTFRVLTSNNGSV